MKFILLLISFLSVSAFAETRIVPGEIYNDVILKELALVGPQTPITILHFNFFTENGKTRELANRLKAIKKQNPDQPIQIILEGDKDSEKQNGVAKRNRLTQKFFEGTGIEVKFISGLRNTRYPGVTHAKAFMIGDTLVIGSTNLTNTSITKNNEFNIWIHSPVLSAAFKNYVSNLLTDSTVLHEVSAKDENVTLLTDTLFLEEALKIIEQAKAGDTLDVTTYFFAYRTEADVNAKRFYDAIVAAKNRGVKMRLYLERNGNPKVSPDITKANIAVAAKLSQAGVTEIYFDPEEKISHSKIIRLIGKDVAVMIVGSTNLYRGDIEENHQINIKIEDRALVEKTGDYLNQKFAYEGTRQVVQPRMIRFWKGFKQASATKESIRDNLNESLVPETTRVGAGRGLIAYLPALFPWTKPDFLPDEIALVAYSNDDAYQAIRTTPRGQEYGPLHFKDGLFARETPEGRRSTSAVAVPYTGGPVKVGSAYLLGDLENDWQQGETVLRVLTLKSDSSSDVEASAQKYFESMARQQFVAGAFLVEKEFIIEILQFSKTPRSIKVPEGFSVYKKLAYQPQEAEKTNLEYSTAINVQFKTELGEPLEMLKPVLDNLKTPFCQDPLVRK